MRLYLRLHEHYFVRFGLLKVLPSGEWETRACMISPYPPCHNSRVKI
jgi:hypothetical protein